MIGYYNYTVIATYAGLLAAVYGIAAVIHGEPFVGILCLIFAGFFDTFDGKIARTRKQSTADEKSFGIQLDSLCDLVAFGVLPASIGYAVSGYSRWYLLPMGLYILTALIRLAYFNVTEYNRQKETAHARQVYEGLPVTAAALVFPLAWCFKAYMGKKFALFYGIVMVITAILFISPITPRKPDNKRLAVILGVGAILFVILLLQRF